MASGCHIAEKVSEYQRGSFIFIVLEVGGVPAPYVVRWFTETKLPTWRVVRFPSLSKESPHTSNGVPIPTHFLGGECFLACTCLLEQEIFILKHILYIFLNPEASSFILFSCLCQCYLPFFSSFLTVGIFVSSLQLGIAPLFIISTFVLK